MRISDWSSDVCSSDLRKPEDEAEHDRCDRADQRPGLGRARPEQAEQEDDRDPRRDEAREFLDILERLIETAKQRSAERRVGKECVSKCRSRRTPDHKKKTTDITYPILPSSYIQPPTNTRSNLSDHYSSNQR